MQRGHANQIDPTKTVFKIDPTKTRFESGLYSISLSDLGKHSRGNFPSTRIYDFRRCALLSVHVGERWDQILLHHYKVAEGMDTDFLGMTPDPLALSHPTQISTTSAPATPSLLSAAATPEAW